MRELVDLLAYLGGQGWVDADHAIVSSGSDGVHGVHAAPATYPGQVIAGTSLYGVVAGVS